MRTARLFAAALLALPSETARAAVARAGRASAGIPILSPAPAHPAASWAGFEPSATPSEFLTGTFLPVPREGPLPSLSPAPLIQDPGAAFVPLPAAEPTGLVPMAFAPEPAAAERPETPRREAALAPISPAQERDDSEPAPTRSVRAALGSLRPAGAVSYETALGQGRRLEDAMTGALASAENTGDVPTSASAATEEEGEEPAALKPAPEAEERAADKAPPSPGLAARARELGSLWQRMLLGDPEMRPFMRKYRAQFWGAQTLQITYSLLGVSLAWGMGRLIDLAVEGEELSGGVHMMIAASALILAVNLIHAGGEWLEDWLEGRLSAHLLRDFRVHLFRHLTTLPLAALRRHKASQLSTRLSDDVSELSRKNVNIPLYLPLALVEILVNGLMLFSIHWGLALGLLALLPVFAWISSVFGRMLENIGERAATKRAEMVERGADVLSNIEMVRAFGAQPTVQAMFAKSVEEHAAVRVEETYVSTWYQTLADSLADLCTKVLVVALGAWALFLWGEPSVGTITSMQIYAYSLAAAIEGFTDTWAGYKEADGSTKRVLSLLKEAPEAPDAPDAEELGPIQGRVRFRDVVFSYNGRVNQLKGVSFEAAPGQTIALVGETGSGKTTALRLLARLYDPKRGSIEIDGRDLRRVKRASLNRQLAIVPQDSALLDGSIRQNLMLVRPDATEEQVRAALEAAHAGFVFDSSICPEGLDTEVGDRATRLSGGQRQRIAIARALLRDPRLLLLDEATASLDNESERLVQSALRQLMKGRTTFVVAHRLTTIMGADKILVFDKGRIVEEGTHDELLARGGKYAALIRASQPRDKN